MMFLLLLAIIAVTALIAGLLVAYHFAAPHIEDDEVSLGEADLLDRYPEIRFRRIEGHDNYNA